MSGIQFVTDQKGRKVGVLIAGRNTAPSGTTYGAALCLNRSEGKRAFLAGRYRATRPKRTRPRG